MSVFLFLFYFFPFFFVKITQNHDDGDQKIKLMKSFIIESLKRESICILISGVSHTICNNFFNTMST